MRVMALLCALAFGCATSNFQSAKMLAPGQTQIGVMANSYSYQEGGNSASEEAIELMGSTAVSETVEVGGKVGWFGVSEGDESINFFNFLLTPKIAIQKDKLAFVAQSGFILATGDGESDNVWITMPGIVFTTEVTTSIYLDLCGKLIGFFSDNFDEYNFAGGANLGFRIQPAGAPWSFGPEVGLMIDDDSASSASDETGFFLQFGAGFHYTFGAPAPSSSSGPTNAPPPPPPAPVGPAGPPPDPPTEPPPPP